MQHTNQQQTQMMVEANRFYWLLGAVINDVDQVDRFIREGIWENGYSDKYIDKVKSIAVGDRVAIKATFVVKKDLPFDNHGKPVSAMSIKAIGTVTSNRGDGRHLLVDWELLPIPKVWYFYTYRGTVWKVVPGNWASDALIRFVFSDQPQDYGRFVNHPYWYDRYGDHAGLSVYRFAWARFYATAADNLLAFRSDRSGLVAWLNKLASSVDGAQHLHDKDSSGKVVPLVDIDPFSVLGVLNRSISDDKRRVLAGRFKSFLDVHEEMPGAFTGIPVLDNRRSLFIRYSGDRGASDIDVLWEVFYQAVLLADGGDDYDPSAFIAAYDKAAALPGVGWNLTMGLFWMRAWYFCPLDRQSRSYIADELGVSVSLGSSKGRCTGEEYLALNEAVAEKLLDDGVKANSLPEMSSLADDDEISSDVSALVAGRLSEFKSLVLRSFPSLTNVSDPDFVAEEIEYKREASALVSSMLPESVFESMMDAGEYSELIALLRSAGSKTNLLYLGTPTKGDLAPLCNAYPDEEGLCRAFYDLIWGSEASWDRLESFYSFVRTAELPAKWPTATYYLFLMHSSSEMFVKPEVMKWVLDFFSMPMSYESNPSGQLYREILELCSELKGQLSGWGVTDMIELNSLIWAAYKAPDVDASVALPEEVYDMNPDSLFTERTFELLGMLHEEPTKEFYSAHLEEFREVLRDPMKKLFTDIAAGMPPEFGLHLETSRKLFSRIPKNDWGKGGAWDYYWGAFYVKGEKRISSDQLYMTVNRDGLVFGYSQGESEGFREKRVLWLREFLSSGRACVKAIGESISAIPGLRYGVPDIDEDDSFAGFEDFASWIAAIDDSRVNAKVFLSAAKVLSLSYDQIRGRIAEAFAALFPFTLRDESAVSALFASVDDEEEFAVNPEVSLDLIHAQTGYDRDWIGRAVAALKKKQQAVFYGPPGTGKTFLAKKIAAHLIGGGCGFADVVQFHPSYSYEDFIEGLRPQALSDGGLEYKLVPGRFKEFCREASKLSPSDSCVLIVDEINRANLSRVFGELMYLLEYRGNNEAIHLAGSSDKFSIPPNVYLIGTMNTADRSIALVDHALRRRFAFVHMEPDYRVLSHFHRATGFDVSGLKSVLTRVNDKIADRNYFIGVSFFLDEDIAASISNVWQLEIEPYLDEYFFDRPEVVEEFKWERVGREITGEE